MYEVGDTYPSIFIAGREVISNTFKLRVGHTSKNKPTSTVLAYDGWDVVSNTLYEVYNREADMSTERSKGLEGIGLGLDVWNPVV